MNWSDETVEAVAKAYSGAPFPSKQSIVKTKAALAAVAECKEVRELHALLVKAEGALTVYRDHWESYDECGYLGKDARQDTANLLTKLHAAGIGGK